MRTLRLLTAAPLALVLAATASAQFDGPAPLAWRWQQPTNAAPSGAPLVVDDTIYTAIGGRVFAIDRATGNLKWRYPQVDPINGVFRTSPVMVDGTLVAAADNKLVYGIDPARGTAKWTYNAPQPILGTPVQVDRYVAFATSDNTLIAVEGATGKAAWEPFHVFDRIQGQIASFGTGIVFFNGLNQLLSLDVVSEKPNYKRPIKFAELPPRAVPVLFGDTFYVASGPYVVAVNAATGLTKWQRPTGLQLAQAPAASASGILVVSEDGDALVLNPLDGRPVDAMRRGPVKLGSFAAVRPTAVGTKFIVPTTNGSLNLFDPTTGGLLWSYVVRPVGEIYEQSSGQGQRPSGGPGGGPGGPPGGGSGGGQRLVTTLQASGPAVLSGQTLIVPAQDGSILAFDKDLGVDLTPPTVKQLFPTPGDPVSGLPPLTLVYRLSDEAAGVNETTVNVQIDGKDAGFTYTRDGYVQVAFSSLANDPAPSRLTSTLPSVATVKTPKRNTVLQNGRHSVVVTAADWMGNVTKQTYSIVIDNALPPSGLPNSDQTGQNRGPGGGRGKGGGAGGAGDGR